MTFPWWIAVSNTSCERRATKGLEERGFEVWWPVRLVEFKTRHMKRPSTRTYPLFPGYLFARGRPYYEMLGIDGLKAILCNDWKPLTISDEELERLKARTAHHALPIVEDAYRIGQTVVVVKGPFQDLEGEVSRIRRRSVDVLFSILGRPTPVVVPMKDLRRAA